MDLGLSDQNKAKVEHSCRFISSGSLTSSPEIDFVWSLYKLHTPRIHKTSFHGPSNVTPTPHVQKMHLKVQETMLNYICIVAKSHKPQE